MVYMIIEPHASPHGTDDEVYTLNPTSPAPYLLSQENAYVVDQFTNYNTGTSHGRLIHENICLI